MTNAAGVVRGEGRRAGAGFALALTLGAVIVAGDVSAAPPSARAPAGPRGSASGAPSSRPARGRWSKTSPAETAPSTPACLASDGASAGCDQPFWPRTRRLGVGLGTAFFQPIGQSGTPPSLLGAELRGFVAWSLRPSFDLRLGLTAAIGASNRGVLLPLGLQVEPLFGLTSEIFWGLSFTGGYLLGPGYQPAADESGLTPSPFVQMQVVPFGFRFGERARGELGMRFGLMASRIEKDDDRSWALSFGTATVWLTYELSSRP